MRPQRFSFAFQHAKSTVVSIVRQAKAYSSETQHESFFFFFFALEMTNTGTLSSCSSARAVDLPRSTQLKRQMGFFTRRTAEHLAQSGNRVLGGAVALVAERVIQRKGQLQSHKACKQDERRKTRAR